MSNEPQVKILGYDGNPFSTNYNMIVRCTIMDTSHWRRGRKFEDEEFKEWNYVPYYLAEMQVSTRDKNAKGVDTSGIRSFKVNVMMSQSYMQWWHRNKGAGYNNNDARRVFVNEWNKYLEKERESEEKPVIDPDLVWASLKNNINNN